MPDRQPGKQGPPGCQFSRSFWMPSSSRLHLGKYSAQSWPACWRPRAMARRCVLERGSEGSSEPDWFSSVERLERGARKKAEMRVRRAAKRIDFIYVSRYNAIHFLST